MFEVRDVHVAYGAVLALHGISLEVRPGEIVCLLGANGAGKSTTLRTISGLLHPLKGEILLGGQSIHRLAPETIVKRGISHVPEGRHVFPGLTVRENMILGASNRPGLRREEMDADMAKLFQTFPDLERLKTPSVGPCPEASNRCWRLPAGSWRSLRSCSWTNLP